MNIINIITINALLTVNKAFIATLSANKCFIFWQTNVGTNVQLSCNSEKKKSNVMAVLNQNLCTIPGST